MEGGEIFVPRIPSVSVTDLAGVLAPGCELEVMGVRPGEKLHETLVSSDEVRYTEERENMFVIRGPIYPGEVLTTPLNRPKDGFSYSSDTNPIWLSRDQLESVLEKEGFMHSGNS